MKVTVCLTSCNRFHLLHRTLNSFTTLNNYPIEEFVITEDSTNKEMNDLLKTHYHGIMPYFTENKLYIMANPFKVVINETNIGQFKSTDNMYKNVKTKYIFHCEDDWLFESNPNFMKESIDILEENENIHQVWIRKDIHSSWVDDRPLVIKTGVNYRMINDPHCGDWCGFSKNPGLIRKEDYVKMFPNGYAEFTQPNTPAPIAEHTLMLHAKNYGYRAAILDNRVIRHIGWR